MGAMTKEDLRTMQGWSLQRKIQVTQTRVYEWLVRYDNQAYISRSGGKDSDVLTDIVRRVCPEIPAVFVDTGLEYPEVRERAKSVDNVVVLRPDKSFKQVIDEYGFPAISKEVSKTVYYARRGSEWAIKRLDGLNKDDTESSFKSRFKKYKYLADAPFDISHRCCDHMKKFPLEKYEKETGRKPIIATMACESQQRESGWLKTGCNAFDMDRPISKPMSFWTEQDILQYIKLTDLPIASVYGDVVPKDTQQSFFNGELTTTGESRTGCMFCMFGCHLDKGENKFQRMARTHPKQYDYCINKLGCGQVLDYIGVPY